MYIGGKKTRKKRLIKNFLITVRLVKKNKKTLVYTCSLKRYDKRN